MPMTPTLRPSRSKTVKGLTMPPRGEAPGVDGFFEDVVGREDGEVGPLLELDTQVERAAVELVVGDERRVGPHRAQRADLGLAGEEVEDGRALEGVAPVEVEHAIRAGALAPDDVGDARGAAGVDDLAVRSEPEARVGLGELEVVGIEARMNVRRVQGGEVNLPVELWSRGGVVVAAGGSAERAQRASDGQPRAAEQRPCA